MFIFLTILLIIAGGVGYYFWSRKQARAELLATPLTNHQRDVIARQDRELAVLTRRVDLLLEREATRESDGGGGVVLGDERPPHY